MSSLKLINGENVHSQLRKNMKWINGTTSFFPPNKISNLLWIWTFNSRHPYFSKLQFEADFFVAFSSKIIFSPTICQYRWMKMVWIPKMTHENHINIDLVNWIWNDCSSICIKFLFCFLDLIARPQISMCWLCWLLIMPVGWGHFKIIVLLVSRCLRFLWKQ